MCLNDEITYTAGIPKDAEEMRRRVISMLQGNLMTGATPYTKPMTASPDPMQLAANDSIMKMMGKGGYQFPGYGPTEGTPGYVTCDCGESGKCQCVKGKEANCIEVCKGGLKQTTCDCGEAGSCTCVKGEEAKCIDTCKNTGSTKQCDCGRAGSCSCPKTESLASCIANCQSRSGSTARTSGPSGMQQNSGGLDPYSPQGRQMISLLNAFGVQSGTKY